MKKLLFLFFIPCVAFALTSATVDLGPTVSGGGGVSSLNSLTGALSLVGGTGISVTPSGTNITISATGGTGTVTSVGLSDGSSTPIFNITNSPVTSSGTLTETLKTQGANTVLAGPTTGSAAQPTFRSLVSADIPNNAANTTGTASNVTSGTFTQGSVIFANGSGQLAQDNSAFFWNDTNQSIGIGTATPDSASFIEGVNASGATKRLLFSGYGASSSVGMRTRFGRGTAGSPTAAQSGDILGFWNSEGYGASQFPTTATVAMTFTADENFSNTSNASRITFNTTPTGSVTSSEQMRIASTGDVLIGTTTDSGTQKLIVSGNSNVGTVTAGTWNGTLTAGQSFLTSGTTYTTPSNITANTVFKFTLIGGGGAGGGTAATSVNHGSGGGAGATCIVYVTGLTASNGYTIAIGSGGTGVSGANGNNGGNTTLAIGATTYTAGFGTGGLTADTSGSAGGACTNTTINITGQSGGSTGSNSGGTVSGPGGNSMYGMGGGSVQSPATGSTNGLNATGYGGGGSGSSGGSASASAGTGGAGTQGAILVEWQN